MDWFFYQRDILYQTGQPGCTYNDGAAEIGRRGPWEPSPVSYTESSRQLIQHIYQGLGHDFLFFSFLFSLNTYQESHHVYIVHFSSSSTLPYTWSMKADWWSTDISAVLMLSRTSQFPGSGLNDKYTNHPGWRLLHSWKAKGVKLGFPDVHLNRETAEFLAGRKWLYKWTNPQDTQYRITMISHKYP